jgi:hypothetical protein
MAPLWPRAIKVGTADAPLSLRSGVPSMVLLDGGLCSARGRELLRLARPFARASLRFAARKTGVKRLTTFHDRERMRHAPAYGRNAMVHSVGLGVLGSPEITRALALQPGARDNLNGIILAREIGPV